MSRKSLIINSPYAKPARHWQQGAGTTLNLVDGRRAAAYEVFDTRNNTKRVEELQLVNRIRERVHAWREADYPGVTQVTRSLLAHWQDRAARTLPFYFCQIEAIETLIWWVEGAEEFRQGIAIPGDGGSPISRSAVFSARPRPSPPGRRRSAGAGASRPAAP